MHPEKIIYGPSADEAFAQISRDFSADRGMLGYSTYIQHGKRNILLLIDIDPGGGFESGFETTILRAPLFEKPSFNFAIHHQGLLDEIGKLFGMQDIETGYSEFDQKVIVKSDHAEKMKALFSNAAVRKTFGDLDSYKLHTIADDEGTAFLELTIDRGILDAEELKRIYEAFVSVLDAFEQSE